MEHIILDTNIFIKENFLEGKRIRQLLKLSEEGKIKIVVTKITVGEVKNRFKLFTRKAIKNLNELKNQFDSRVLRNCSAGRKIYSRIISKEIEKEFNDSLDTILTKSKVIIIDYRELNIESVFENYFKNKYPFNSGDKKNEFPDAFTLLLVEKWCAEKKVKCKIFSADEDFLNFKSQYFEVEKNYESYLDKQLQYLIQQDRILVLQELFEKNSDRLDEEIEEWYRFKLNDDSLYYPVVWVEIHDIDVSEVKIKEKSYQIVSIDDESIELEVMATLTFKVDIVIDDELHSYYDSEDKKTYFFGTKTEEIERNEIAVISVVAHIVDKDEYDEELEVIEINKDENLVIEEHFEDYR